MSDDALAALEARVAELETQATFQDDLHQRLDETVARQDRELASLAQRVKELEARLTDLAEAASQPGGSAGHEVPPHY